VKFWETKTRFYPHLFKTQMEARKQKEQTSSWADDGRDRKYRFSRLTSVTKMTQKDMEEKGLEWLVPPCVKVANEGFFI
jgi:hypothetical protein